MGLLSCCCVYVTIWMHYINNKSTFLEKLHGNDTRMLSAVLNISSEREREREREREGEGESERKCTEMKKLIIQRMISTEDVVFFHLYLFIFISRSSHSLSLFLHTFYLSISLLLSLSFFLSISHTHTHTPAHTYTQIHTYKYTCIYSVLLRNLHRGRSKSSYPYLDRRI